MSDIKNIKLAELGKKKIYWAGRQMHVLEAIKQDLRKSKSLKGYTIGCCLHVTSETANLMIALKEGGAKVALCASNPLSTQDDIAASLVKDYKIDVFAIHGEGNKSYYKHINLVLDKQPQITMDDGADLISILHSERIKQISKIIGSSEETTTGVIRLRAMEKDQALKLPVIAVNDSDTKHLFDNRYGTGQSTIDGILRATNILLAGKNFVVIGYGWCSRGIASRARGMGAKVTITEVDPIKALEAAMDGYYVDSIKNASLYGDIFVSATGNKHVIDLAHIKNMKDGAILANSGHFNVEINLAGLKKITKSEKKIRDNLVEYKIGDKTVFVLSEGRLVNLSAAEGHPAEVMDLSFSNQAMAVKYLIKNKGKLENKVYTLPKSIDREVARLKLKAMGINIDKLTKQQENYLNTWKEGT